MSDYQTLRVERSDGIATLVIDRPEKLNALDRAAIAELQQAVDSIEADDTIRGVIVTGSGDRAFVAGADIREFATLTAASGLELSRRGQDLFRRIELSKKVFVAAVNGFALGGGCELALACHLRIASSGAHFGFPEVTLGLIPGYGGTVRLPRLIGRGRALEMVLTGEMVSAEDALAMGLVNRVVPASELLDAARALLGRITRNAPLAVSAALESTISATETTSADAFALEAFLFGRLASTADLQEGVAAFQEKRPPAFEGR